MVSSKRSSDPSCLQKNSIFINQDGVIKYGGYIIDNEYMNAVIFCTGFRNLLVHLAGSEVINAE